jgi:hypothetical protein
MKSKFLCLLLIAAMFSVVSCKKEGEGSNVPAASNEYVVFAWNNLGMHCLNPTYNELVILPPYNTVQAQVIKRGDPPQIITSGVTVEFSIMNNTSSYRKRAYGGFWDNFTALFGGTPPAHDIGLTGTGLSGTMANQAGTNFYIAEGVPLVPVNDAGIWNPYQVYEITVKDNSNNLLVTTEATAPTSDEINCAKCHTAGTTSVFTNILHSHDVAIGTSLVSQEPVLCASCHGSPALGTNGPGSSGKYLSQAIHSFHATKNASCYDCHPGTATKCSRSIRHMGSTGDGNCTTCHGQLADVASSIDNGRVPWVTEPKCVDCHTGVDGVDTGTDLYRNANGHGNVMCAACHGSPHAMYPAREVSDNYQPNQYQGSTIKSIGSCGVCHGNSRGDGVGGEFSSTHGGSNPGVKNACFVCHTSISTNTASWPHAYTWKNSN